MNNTKDVANPIDKYLIDGVWDEYRSKDVEVEYKKQYNIKAARARKEAMKQWVFAEFTPDCLERFSVLIDRIEEEQVLTSIKPTHTQIPVYELYRRLPRPNKQQPLTPSKSLLVWPRRNYSSSVDRFERKLTTYARKNKSAVLM